MVATTTPRRTRVRAHIELEGVSAIERRGLGPVYRAVISVGQLYDYLRHSFVLYSPRFQRGYDPKLIDVEDERFNDLLPITHPDLQINRKRSEAMAAKLLTDQLYTVSIVWNARQEAEGPEPEYDEETQTLVIPTKLTIPDSAHRQYAYYLAASWAENPEKIPEKIEIYPGEFVDKETILEILENKDTGYGQFDPDNELIYVDIYTLPAHEEGKLYAEFNEELRPPSTATGIDLNPTKTAARRFIYRLIAISPIFARDEIEMRRNTIGTKSRKLTTNATLEGAVRPFNSRLKKLENTPQYDDLIEFFNSFFEEWGKKYPAWQPGASADERNGLRETSFALSNIMFHPLFRLILDLWESYNTTGIDWRTDKSWKDAIAKLTGKVPNPEVPGETIEVMNRNNPAWRGRIVIESRDRMGNRTWSLSSTRQTREAAYSYLRDIAGLNEQ